MAIMGGFVAPIVKVLIKYFATEELKTKGEEVALQPNSWITKLPFALRPLVALPPSRDTIIRRDSSTMFNPSTVTVSTVAPNASNPNEPRRSSATSFSVQPSFRMTASGYDIRPSTAPLSSSPLRQMKQAVFDKNRFVARVSSFLAVMISFGIFFPPLLIVLGLAICSMTLYEQWSIGDILSRSNQLGYHWYWYKLCIDLEGMIEAFLSVMFPVALVTSWLYACLLFDTFGDKYSVNHAITIAAPFVIISMTYLIHFIVTRLLNPAKHAMTVTKQVVEDEEKMGHVQDNGPGRVTVEMKPMIVVERKTIIGTISRDKAHDENNADVRQSSHNPLHGEA